MTSSDLEGPGDEDRPAQQPGAGEGAELIIWVGPFSEWVTEFTSELLLQGLDQDTLQEWTLNDISDSFRALDG